MLWTEFTPALTRNEEEPFLKRLISASDERAQTVAKVGLTPRRVISHKVLGDSEGEQCNRSRANPIRQLVQLSSTNN